MDGGLSSEAPRHRQKGKIAAAIVGVVGVSDGMVRDSRMQIDRNVQRLRACENAPKSFIVEEGSGGQAVNQRTPKIVLRNGAFEFIGRGLGIDGRQLSEAGKPRRVRARCRVKHVIGFASQCNRSLGVEDLRSRLHM